MSETRFTPGPWKAYEATEASPYPVGVIQAVGTEAGSGSRDSIVCEMVAQGDGRYDPAVTNANGYLIAAAPDLYAALEYPRFGDTANLLDKAVEQIEILSRKLNELTGENWTPLYLHHYANAAQDIRAVLAKARGES